jgi:multisubunit Na+/H+ antiporter MnhG subunit
MNEAKKITKDFWILSIIFSLSAIIGIVANPSNLSPNGKFTIGVVLGIGLACLIIALIILIKNNRQVK